MLLSLVAGYLLGSIPFTQVIAKAVKGIDLRQVGSRNVGGRNTIHNVGLGWGLLAGILDVLKGAAAVWAATLLGLSFPQFLFVGLAAIAGHNWPLWLGFRGGKGLAPLMGVIAWVALPEAVISVALGIIFLRLTGNMTLTTLFGFLLVLALANVFGRPTEVSWLILGSALLVLIATLPSIFRMLLTPGGVRRYFQDPNEAYHVDAGEMQNE